MNDGVDDDDDDDDDDVVCKFAWFQGNRLAYNESQSYIQHSYKYIV